MAKKAEQAALATSGGQQIQMAEAVEMPKDWLSDVLGDEDLDVTGTEGMGAEDVRLPTWALNAKSGKDADTGRAVPPDVFWNTLTEKAKPTLRLVVLTNMKTREWRESDDNDDLVTKCRSFDCVTGEMEDGTTRPCDGCPDYEWRTDEKGKRFRRCTDVYNVLGLDRETQEVGMLRVKKTAIKSFKNFYQKGFYKKRPKKNASGKVSFVDMPFFVYETVVESEENKTDKFTWYTPRFTLGGALPKDEILAMGSLVKSYLSDHADRLHATMAVDEDVIDVADDNGASAGGSSGGDGKLDAAAFSDDGGEGGGGGDAEAGANRF